MSEWWTYRPGDFLMFAPRTYWRLFELHNHAAWPLPALLLAAGLACFWFLSRPPHTARPLRALAVALALAWLAVGGLFLHERYGEVFWVMRGAAWAFGAQALGLLLLAASGGLHPASAHAHRGAGLCLWALAALVLPALAGLSGRPWAQAEIIGLAPDPTVIASLGLLLCSLPPQGASRALYECLWLLALAWCAVSAATLWTMGSWQGCVPALAACLAVGVRVFPRPRPLVPG